MRERCFRAEGTLQNGSDWKRGENVVKNAFFEILQWVPRTDDLDDGIDLNVEIPPQETRPNERFLVQVRVPALSGVSEMALGPHLSTARHLESINARGTPCSCVAWT